MDKKEPAQTNFKDVIAIFLLRTMDSGLTPWLMVAGFLLTCFYLLARNLDSHDTLTLISDSKNHTGVAWVGWPVAFCMIPLAKWAVNRERKLRIDQIKQLQEEVTKCRELLKKYQRDELAFEQKRT